MNTLSKISSKILRASAWCAVVGILACSVSVDSEGEEQNTALIDRLPAGATAIAWMDLESLAGTLSEEDWAEYQDMVEDDQQQFDRFVEVTGLDPRQDMKQIGAAVMPDGNVDDPWVLLISADFDRDKLLGLANGADSVDYEGITFYAANEVFANLETAIGHEPEAGDENSMEVDAGNDSWLAILDDTTLAMGAEESLRVIVDVENGQHEALKSDPEMNDLISDVAGRGQIWFVAHRDAWGERVDDLSQGGGMVPTQAIESIQVLTMAMRLGDGLNLRLTGLADSADAAAELVTSLNGLLAIGRMMMQQSDPELFDLIDRGLTVGQDDRTVNIEAALSDEDLEVLKRMAEDQLPQSEIGSDA